VKNRPTGDADAVGNASTTTVDQRQNLRQDAMARIDSRIEQAQG